MTKAQEWAGAKLTNGAFLDYANEIVRVADAFDEEKIPVASTVQELAAVCGKLVDFINESAGYDETRRIAEYDAWRDAIYKAIWHAVEYLAEIPVDDGLGDKARIVKTALGAYKGIDRHKLAQETEEIWGLKHDVEKSQRVSDAIKALKIEIWFNQLFNINESFGHAYQERNDAAIARSAEKGGESTVSLRKEAAGLIATLVRRVNYICEFTPSAEAAAAANALNVIIAKYKTVAASRKSSGKEDPDGAKTPSAK